MKARFAIGVWSVGLTLCAQPPGGPRGPLPFEFGRGGGIGPGQPSLMQTVTGAPYSGVEVRTTEQVLANGNLIRRQEQSTVYRDSQGRVRIESTRQRPDGQMETRVTIADPVAGVIHELDVANKTSFDRPARFTQADAGTPGRGRGSAAFQLDASVKREALTTQSVNGVYASGSRETRTIAAGSIGNSQAIDVVRETWISDELKVPVLTKISDPRSGSTVTQLTNINRSEPDAALFQVPSDYSVQQPRGGRMGMRWARPNRREGAATN